LKTSKIKRLVSRKLARQFVAGNRRGADGLREFLEHEAGDTIARMRGRGYELVACLETGEAVFARTSDVVGLHIQLPSALYRVLDKRCQERGATKRQVVIDALENYLNQG
jgi:hypothetical protein